ncbi:MAG TPA: folate-binding protein [Candidatus Binatia bacterium]|nr:folate-binding protein [Candidatus Binatia bacterium]
MGLTALQAQEQGFGAVEVAEYRGATTAARFGDPQAEFAALREGCGVYDLGYRAKISLTGDDRVRWLNGMVTNNVRDLAPGQGTFAFLLNAQGHILGDLYAYNRGESIVVDTDRSQLEKILATFDHYIIMDDIEVKNLSAEVTALGIGGPKAHEILTSAGFAIPKMQALQIESVSWNSLDRAVVRTDDPHHLAYEIWLATAEVKQLWDALVAAGATPVGAEALELHRIVAGVPRYGVDIRERDLPQETEQARALNFNKGCYVGQEIVERIRSRGAVHRMYTGFIADAPVEPGSKVLAGEKQVGEITSSARVRLSNADRIVALGYIRREVGAPGREVMIGAVKATVSALPITEDSLRERASAFEQRPA